MTCCLLYSYYTDILSYFIKAGFDNFTGNLYNLN
jgi:hypothetical protein